MMETKMKKSKVCKYCAEKRDPDYKNYAELREFMSEHGKIFPRRMTFLCAKHQRKLANEIKKSPSVGAFTIRSSLRRYL
jgi:small subunit ribosomal protein S18